MKFYHQRVKNISHSMVTNNLTAATLLFQSSTNSKLNLHIYLFHYPRRTVQTHLENRLKLEGEFLSPRQTLFFDKTVQINSRLICSNYFYIYKFFYIRNNSYIYAIDPIDICKSDISITLFIWFHVCNASKIINNRLSNRSSRDNFTYYYFKLEGCRLKYFDIYPPLRLFHRTKSTYVN